MSGKMSRNKGSRCERQLVEWLQSRGWDAKRIPLSGAMRGFKGDVVAERDGIKITFELKARAALFNTLYKFIGTFKGLINDRLAVMRYEGPDVYRNQYKYLDESCRLEKSIFKWRDDWLKGEDVLVLKGDRQPFLFVFTQENKHLEDHLSQSKPPRENS